MGGDSSSRSSGHVRNLKICRVVESLHTIGRPSAKSGDQKDLQYNESTTYCGLSQHWFALFREPVQLKWAPPLYSWGDRPPPQLPNPFEIDICNDAPLKSHNHSPLPIIPTNSLPSSELIQDTPRAHLALHSMLVPLHYIILPLFIPFGHVASTPRICNEGTATDLTQNSATSATQYHFIKFPPKCHEVMTLALRHPSTL